MKKYYISSSGMFWIHESETDAVEILSFAGSLVKDLFNSDNRSFFLGYEIEDELFNLAEMALKCFCYQKMDKGEANEIFYQYYIERKY